MASLETEVTQPERYLDSTLKTPDRNRDALEPSRGLGGGPPREETDPDPDRDRDRDRTDPHRTAPGHTSRVTGTWFESTGVRTTP